jgi:hypothetical protein
MDIYNGPDSVRFYTTGAGADGSAQTNEALSIGSYRSGSEIASLSWSVGSPIANVTIDYVSGNNGTGSGTLTATGADTLTWTAPSGAAGTAVTILNGETKVLQDAGDTNKYIRVTRTSATALTGTATLTIVNVANNVVGMRNVFSGEASAGATIYRLIAFKNHNASVIGAMKAYVRTLGTQQTSDSTQLGASGSGTVTTTGSFSDWPATGYVRIATSTGTLREVAYYSSRTSTALTVPAAGRAIFGTAAAGASTDLINAVPGIEIGYKAPTSQPSGSFTAIANETTAPSAVTFTSGITAATGADVGNVVSGNIGGIWVKRKNPAGVVATTGVLHGIGFTFDS